MAGDDLRAEVVAAVLAEITRVGTDFDGSAIVKRFSDRGVSRATLYRWIQGAAKQQAGPHIARTVKKKAAEARKKAAKKGTAASEEIAGQVGEVLPPPVDPQELADAATHPVVRRLTVLMESAERVLQASCAADGTPLNKKMVLSAVEVQRRCLDTLVRTAEVINGAAQIEAFHQAIMAEIAKESPELAARVLLRLQQLMARWGL